MLLILFSLLFPLSFGLKTVTTSYGKIRGISDYTNQEDQKFIFKGVPFAKPPIGKLRFSLPQKPDAWKGVLDASKYSPACMSNSTLTSTPQKYISEDCLYTNIFTSESCLKNKCPVIVYYHGGSFSLDSATMFPDKFILERYVDRGIVFVIPAYRLGVFGQFYLGDMNIVPTNLLIYDAIEALNYVHEEIQNFGGNPNDVTIMGHSSGGELVNAIGFSNDIDPGRKLFQKFIVLSAHPMFGFEIFKLNNSFEVARRFDCVSGNHQEIVDCLRKVNANDIIQAQKAMEENGMEFKTILQAPPLMDLNQKIADFKKNAPPRKLLCGVAEHEFEKFKYGKYRVNGKFLDFENPVEVIMTYRSNFTYLTPNLLNSDSSAVFVSAATYSEALVNAGGVVYLFETRQKPYSMHVSDMQYFIGIHREKTHTSDMDVLDSFYSEFLVNFTKYGEPSPYWEKLDPEKMNFLALEIDSKSRIPPKMEDGFHEELVNFWMIDMMELDRNITQQKETNEKATYPSLTTPKIPDYTSSQDDTVYNTTIMPQDSGTQNDTFHNATVPYTDPLPTPETFPIYNQWWFYAIIICIVVIASVLILMCLRKPSTEIQPLLA